jgi:uncharacterized membrane protein
VLHPVKNSKPRHPLAIPLLLLDANVIKIWRETGKFLVIFLIGAAGIFVGALVGTVLLLHYHFT